MSDNFQDKAEITKVDPNYMKNEVNNQGKENIELEFGTTKVTGNEAINELSDKSRKVTEGDDYKESRQYEQQGNQDIKQ